MGPLEGFLATWSRAFQTFGQGVPAAGSGFSRSAALHQLKAQVESAAPGDQWLGGAAKAYAAANDEHALVVGKLADLDARLAAEVDKSAALVTSGRAELNAVREWVLTAASSVPGNHAGQMTLASIVSRGLGQLAAIVSKTNGELNAIGAQIQQIGQDYAALSRQKFAG